MTKDGELADFIAIKDELLALLEPLDEERMNRVPFPGSWTTDGIVAYVPDHDLSFICLDFELPGTGALTGLEWIHFLSTHTRRHVRQLRNIVEKLKTGG